jgi:hypothetical protein
LKAHAEKSRRFPVFRSELNNKTRHKFERAVELPSKPAQTGRVVGTFSLGPTSEGLDPWDRFATLYLRDDSGKKVEVLRVITPYRKGWTWSADLTYLLPMLTGKKTFVYECETYAEGWNVSFDLDYFEGRLSPKPSEIIPLWQATYDLGTGKPGPAPILLKLGKFRRATTHVTVTGHGQHPNTSNAAEFLPLWRTLKANATEFKDRLWKTDVYLNPCRPQGGTWKYDRAGWSPGSIVLPWVTDVTKHVRSGENTFTYDIEPYVNKSPAEGNQARHVIESVLVLYR